MEELTHTHTHRSLSTFGYIERNRNTQTSNECLRLGKKSDLKWYGIEYHHHIHGFRKSTLYGILLRYWVWKERKKERKKERETHTVWEEVLSTN